MFLPNSHSFLLVRPVIKKPVIHPIRSSLAEVSLETRAFGASETSNGIQSGIKEPATSLPPFSSSDSGSPRFGEAGRKIFLPNSLSFLLARSVTLKPVIHPIRSSLAEVSLETCAFGTSETSNGIQESVPTSASGSSPSDSGDSSKPTIGDKDKRTFLKLAGIAGASIIGSLLLPKKADALIMGSSPTTGVVGVKNSTNTRINPATEETVSSLLKTSDLTFDTGSLNVKVTSLPAVGNSFSDSGGVAKSGLVNAARHVQVDVLTSALPSSASTETTLQTISFGGKKYALKMTTVDSIDYVAEADTGTATSSALWRAKKVDSTTGIVITWADGNANFDNVATNLPGLTYL